MDYGPTIAAAFAAREEEMVHSPTHRGNNRGGGRENNDVDFTNTTNDVASLRKIVLGCMRNARDAALVASRGGGGGGEGETEDVYRGRYSGNEGGGGDYNNAARAAAVGGGGTMNDRSGAKNMGYHQAFSAESTPRRRMDMDGFRQSSSGHESVKTEESAEVVAPATNGVVDLLG